MEELHRIVRRTVLIANHSEQSWRGRIEVKNVTDNYGKCAELLRGRESPFTKDNDGYSIVAEVPAS